MSHRNQPVNPYQDHGRLEQRSIDVFTPPAGLIHDPNLQQVARITRYREPLKPLPSVPYPETPEQKDKGPSNPTETTTIATEMCSLPKTPVKGAPETDPLTARA